MFRRVQGEPAIRTALEAGRPRARAAERGSVTQVVRAALPLAAGALLIAGLSWPMLFTNAQFVSDWPHHLWLMWKQSLAIREGHAPSFFLNYGHGVFYPEFAFYGGTLYAVLGTLSLALGDAPIETYVLSYLLGFAASYGGWYWLARAAGLGRWWAQVPGALFVTSAYYLTLIYARGDQAEFLAVSSIPLVVAAALSVLRAERLRFWPALALVAAGTVFFGSHSLTLIWGSTSMVLTAVLVLAFIPDSRRWLTRRGVARVACLVVPALLLSAWFLLPAIAYEARTEIAREYLGWRATLQATMSLVSAPTLFTISRASAGSTHDDFVLSLPVLAMGWSLLTLLACLGHRPRGAWVRLLGICAALTALLTIVMTHAGLILALPRPYAFLQFAYRLESYVLLFLAATVLVGLVLARTGGRRLRGWAWVTIPILLVAVIGGIQQVRVVGTSGDRDLAVASPAGAEPGEAQLVDYSDTALPLLVARGRRPPEVSIPETAVHGDRASQTVHLRPGEDVYSNIDGGPELVHVSGARIIGIGDQGGDVLEIGPSTANAGQNAAGVRSRWTEVISLSLADSLPVVAGRVISLVALAFLVGLFVWLALRGSLRRRVRRVPETGQ